MQGLVNDLVINEISKVQKQRDTNIPPPLNCDRDPLGGWSTTDLFVFLREGRTFDGESDGEMDAAFERT